MHIGLCIHLCVDCDFLSVSEQVFGSVQSIQENIVQVAVRGASYPLVVFVLP